MTRKTLPFLLLALIATLYAHAQVPAIKANDKNLSYQGRIIFRGDSAALSWTGNSIEINFKGTEMGAVLKDERGENYFKVILDGKPLPDIHLDASKHFYKLAAGLENGNHTMQLFKRTEWIFGKTWFYGFDVGQGGMVNKKTKMPKRAVEFYGNSITCGYGDLDNSGKDRGTPEFEDGYLSYAALTARHFNARYSCIARSGIGIAVSWFPQIMPELYDRLDPNDSTSKWDFKQNKPQVVVVNLMQNDSWIVKQLNHPQYLARFANVDPDALFMINVYQNFIRSLRAKYPKATIICVLGNMDISKPGSDWRGYLAIAVKTLKDKKVLAHVFEYKDTPGHPQLSEQQAMADDLSAFIQEKVGWDPVN